MKSALRIAVSSGLLIASLLACGGSAPQTGESRGVVTAVDPAARTVTLDHEDIPGLMKGMTMTFAVAPDVALEGIGPGAPVSFAVKEEGGDYVVTEIEPRP